MFSLRVSKFQWFEIGNKNVIPFGSIGIGFWFQWLRMGKEVFDSKSEICKTFAHFGLYKSLDI